MENIASATDLGRYNPEGSALRRDQKELFRMLKVVDGICKEHGIQWWLSSGTLLGAARHKGFIPWDDDIDIVLLREDYLKLEKILCEMDDPEFVYHCIKTDTDYVNIYGKFRKRHGKVSSTHRRYDYYKWAGIGLDIFAIEKTSYVSAALGRFFFKIGQKMTLNIRNTRIRHAAIRFVEFCNFKVLFPFFRLIGRINPKQEYHYALGSGWAKHTFYMKYTFPLISTEFEGTMMPVPCDMDSYLTTVFGDWRKIPSEEVIRKSIHCQEYKDEIFGKN